MSEDQNQKQEYENTARGHMIATSVGGTATGKGGDIIVEDDMLNSKEADSAAARGDSLSMHSNILPTRLDNPKTGSRIVVEQRTHVDDVSGYVLKQEKDWTHVCLPMEAEKKCSIVFPISGRIVEREADELLNPKHRGEHEVAELKRAMGSRSYAAQCQQNPTSELGNILKRGWWKHWHVEPDGYDIVIQSWDTTFKETKKGSYVCGQAWGKRSANFYLLGQIRARMNFNDAVKAIENFSVQYPRATGKLIEDKANGPAIISTLKNKIPGIIAVTPIGSKASRAQNIAPVIESGNVHIPDPLKNPWVADFIEECAAFKGIHGELNDQVDAMSQALCWLLQLAYEPEVQDDGIGNSFIEDEEAELDPIGGFVNA